MKLIDLRIVDMPAPSLRIAEITFQSGFLTGQFSRLLINLIFFLMLYTSQDERWFTFLPVGAFWGVI
jgi:hypothetical protein